MLVYALGIYSELGTKYKSRRTRRLWGSIKKLEGGRFSSFVHTHFQPSMVLDVSAPTGNFILNLQASNKKHYVAFAAGSGITPVISLLKTILQEEPLSRFTLIYGNRSRTAVIFREELMALKNDFLERFQLIPIFSWEKMDAPVFERRIDAAKCELIFNNIIPLVKDQEYLLCGPAPMIFAVRDWLLAKKIEEKKIDFELLSDPGESGVSLKKVASEKKESPGGKSQVSIRLEGLSSDFDIPAEGPTMLEASIHTRTDLPYARRAGVCASCRAKLVQGKVTMEQNYAQAEEELEE